MRPRPKTVVTARRARHHAASVDAALCRRPAGVLDERDFGRLSAMSLAARGSHLVEATSRTERVPTGMPAFAAVDQGARVVDRCTALSQRRVGRLDVVAQLDSDGPDENLVTSGDPRPPRSSLAAAAIERATGLCDRGISRLFPTRLPRTRESPLPRTWEPPHPSVQRATSTLVEHDEVARVQAEGDVTMPQRLSKPSPSAMCSADACAVLLHLQDSVVKHSADSPPGAHGDADISNTERLPRSSPIRSQPSSCRAAVPCRPTGTKPSTAPPLRPLFHFTTVAAMSSTEDPIDNDGSLPPPSGSNCALSAPRRLNTSKGAQQLLKYTVSTGEVPVIDRQATPPHESPGAVTPGADRHTPSVGNDFQAAGKMDRGAFLRSRETQRELREETDRRNAFLKDPRRAEFSQVNWITGGCHPPPCGRKEGERAKTEAGHGSRLMDDAPPHSPSNFFATAYAALPDLEWVVDGHGGPEERPFGNRATGRLPHTEALLRDLVAKLADDEQNGHRKSLRSIVFSHVTFGTTNSGVSSRDFLHALRPRVVTGDDCASSAFVTAANLVSTRFIDVTFFGCEFCDGDDVFAAIAALTSLPDHSSSCPHGAAALVHRADGRTPPPSSLESTSQQAADDEPQTTTRGIVVLVALAIRYCRNVPLPTSLDAALQSHRGTLRRLALRGMFLGAFGCRAISGALQHGEPRDPLTQMTTAGITHLEVAYAGLSSADFAILGRGVGHERSPLESLDIDGNVIQPADGTRWLEACTAAPWLCRISSHFCDLPTRRFRAMLREIATAKAARLAASGTAAV